MKRRNKMKGNAKIIEHLNLRLAEELSAINQYMVHAEMCENWKYQRLDDTIQKRAIVEMKHAEKLIERILFLEGQPVVSNLNQINIGSDIQKIHEYDLKIEEGAVRGYNETIRLATEVGDNNTKTLLESILKDEEDHIDWIEGQFGQIKQMGLQPYLAEQIYS
jgi:bacterioferritin